MYVGYDAPSGLVTSTPDDPHDIEPLSDIWRLLLNSDEDVAGFVVETLGRVVVANILDGLADDLLIIELGLGSDLAKDHNHAGLRRSLTSNLRPRVLGETGVQLWRQRSISQRKRTIAETHNSIGNLVADFIYARNQPTSPR